MDKHGSVVCSFGFYKRHLSYLLKRQPSPLFQVIWCPKLDFQQLMIHRQTIPGVCGLARLGTKMGLRCLIEKAPEVYAVIRPDQTFLPPGKKLHFLMGPFPWGTVKSGVCEVLKSIGWVARPLQALSIGPHVPGVMFKVQAIELPPQQTVALAHGDVVITRQDPEAEDTQVAPTVIGSHQTRALVSSDSKAGDLLQIHDPWAKPKQAQPQRFALSDPLQDMEERVVEAVLAKLPKERMEVDGDDLTSQRLADLESKMEALGASHQGLQSTVREQGIEQATQLQQLQVTVQKKHDQLETSIKSQTSGLQEQFQHQLHKQQVMLDQMFTRQMNQFEAMLATHDPKKQRKE